MSKQEEAMTDTERFEAELDDYGSLAWYETETAAEAQERMTPAEQEADRQFAARECGLCREPLRPAERTVCDWCAQMQQQEYCD